MLKIIFALDLYCNSGGVYMSLIDAATYPFSFAIHPIKDKLLKKVVEVFHSEQFAEYKNKSAPNLEPKFL